MTTVLLAADRSYGASTTIEARVLNTRQSSVLDTMSAGGVAVGSPLPGVRSSGVATGSLPPAFQLTLSTGTQVSSERLVLYGRSASARTDAATAPAEATDADPARLVDRKIAEGRKQVAALQIRQTKVAARDAGVLALLNPAGGLDFAKHTAKSLTNAMETFGEAEKTIRRVEDDSLAETAPEEVTAIAHDVYDATASVAVSVDGHSAVDAAVARRVQGRDPTAPGADSAAGSSTDGKLEVSNRVEALSIVHVEDDSNVAAKAAEVEAARAKRMGEDADTIKDGVSSLRSLDRLIAQSTQRLQETGRWDARAAQDASEARAAWHDAVAATAVAALPVVKAGYSIIPDDGQ